MDEDNGAPGQVSPERGRSPNRNWRRTNENTNWRDRPDRQDNQDENQQQNIMPLMQIRFGPGQVSPERGRSPNRNWRRTNENINWRDRPDRQDNQDENQQQNIMPLMQIRFGPAFQMRGRERGLGPAADKFSHANVTKGNVRQNNINAGYKRTNRCPRALDFKALTEMAQADNEDIIPQLILEKLEFFELINQINSENSPDMFVLIMQILSKVCQSSFDEIKSQFVLEICNSDYIKKLCNYLMDLPYMTVKAKNSLYWNKQQEFWTNFIIFCESIVNLSPTTALNKCRSLIEGTSKCCLEGLTERHHFELQEQYNAKLEMLRERLTVTETEERIKARPVYRLETQGDDNVEPPEYFRDLSVLPRREDLMEQNPFLRSNVVSGRYRDTEHYLDVQFRLLREDCFGPLRDGITQYMENPNNKKYDNIRIFRNVKFLMPYASNNKVGSLVQFDKNTVKNLKNINWENSKRLIFGSLLLFTKDNCRSFITATILDRDPIMLRQGQILISVIDEVATKNLYNAESYVMIESEVYFEPYYHVLKVLQDPKFPEQIAMRKYIIDVDSEPKPPAYLTTKSTYKVITTNNLISRFTVLDDQTWPSEEDLGLNASQYEAYKLALTHEFAVIQGPPGTGKTFIGVKVAKTLLDNNRFLDGPMLVICYTNHALDQFLEALLLAMESVPMVRIGGQSKSEEMKIRNLTEIRHNRLMAWKRGNTTEKMQRRMFYKLKYELKWSIVELQEEYQRSQFGKKVISFDTLKHFVPECQVLGRYYASHMRANVIDPLEHWLFELMDIHYFEYETEAENYHVQNITNDDENNIRRLRFGVDLDDLELSEDEDIIDDGLAIRFCFSLQKTEEQLKMLGAQYKKEENPMRQNELQQEIAVLKYRLNLYNTMLTNRRNSILNINDTMDLSEVSLIDRWALYFKWECNVSKHMRRTRNIKQLQKSYESANTAYEEVRMSIDRKILQETRVIGMTTSGAARLRKLLLDVGPSIVIIEEAAEVLEQHIVTALSQKCEHLIFIGDHQQLRPSAAHMKLARHHNLEVSLFERMINNGIHSRRLSVQHRMRPEIAALISPHIYEGLENHPSVELFPRVRGMADNNLFFFTHDHHEEQEDDSASRKNMFEGDMTLRLANYLMQQGYEPQDITILAAYSGQLFYLRKQREDFALLADVKITVVDNYQGEESKIILLSLVRNNNENKIGFLAIDNRVCVALSRAREGFYIFGNINMLKNNSELWTKISDTLEKNSSIGTSHTLRCENHNKVTLVATPADFDNVPEGGCLAKCEFNLSCGHICPLFCHGYDRGHNDAKCYRPCEREICDLQHPCPLQCFAECQPCQEKVLKKLPCDHSMLIDCAMDPSHPDVKCDTMLPVTLPHCKHEVNIPCHVKIEKAICTMKCEVRVDQCGHECQRNCHVNDDSDHEMYLCEKPCAKAKNGCTANLYGDRGDHQCPRKCYETCDDCNVKVMKKRSNCKHSTLVACKEDVNETPCKNNCARMLVCGHFCKKKCFEACGDCSQMVIKEIPECKHKVKTICTKPATPDLCRRTCERLMSCGHKCPDRCDIPCEPTKCNELVPILYQSPCGHKVMLPCKLQSLMRDDIGIKESVLLKYCKEPCNRTLDCNHICVGTCSSCHQGRLHAACTKTCNQTNICGHQCLEPCNQACPPCTMPCAIKCPHSRCNKLCGTPCVPCQEKCTRSCKHRACKKRCGEPCDVPPCDEPCDKMLPCGHPCRGLCGDPCPDICKICNPDDHRLVDFLGNDHPDDTKFIQFQDCPHSLDVENMNNLMTGDMEIINVRCCPFCRKPIINTQRYKDLVNVLFKNEINPIKEKVHGRPEQINTEKQKLLTKITEFSEVHASAFRENQHLTISLEQLRFAMKTEKKGSLNKLKMQSLYLNILDLITDCYEKFKGDNLTELSDEFNSLVKTLCHVLSANTRKISRQMQLDIGNELKRMNSVIQLSRILNHDSYQAIKDHREVVAAVKLAKNIVFTWRVYREDEGVQALEKLQKAVNVKGIVTKQERDLIVSIIASKAGSWYRCPNGHFYSIADCEGAIVISKCADCGVEIGGNRSCASNAGEVDGSTNAVLSDISENFANLHLYL